MRDFMGNERARTRARAKARARTVSFFPWARGARIAGREDPKKGSTPKLHTSKKNQQDFREDVVLKLQATVDATSASSVPNLILGGHVDAIR